MTPTAETPSVEQLTLTTRDGYPLTALRYMPRLTADAPPKGHLIVAADHFDLDAKLGLLLGAFRKTIEKEIQDILDRLLAASAAKPAAHKPKK